MVNIKLLFWRSICVCVSLYDLLLCVSSSFLYNRWPTFYALPSDWEESAVSSTDLSTSAQEALQA